MSFTNLHDELTSILFNEILWIHSVLKALQLPNQILIDKNLRLPLSDNIICFIKTYPVFSHQVVDNNCRSSTKSFVRVDQQIKSVREVLTDKVVAVVQVRTDVGMIIRQVDVLVLLDLENVLDLLSQILLVVFFEL